MGGFIWGFTGVEGSGKSCCMTAIALQHGIEVANYHGYKTLEAYCSAKDDEGKFLNPKPVYCFEGFQLHGSGRNSGIKLSETIDTSEWLGNFGDEAFRNRLILIDEVQNFMDSSQSMSVFSRLLNHAMAQRRRAGIGLMYTLQNWEWLHKRLRWSTHFLSVCKDLSRTRWGKKNGIQKGEQLAVMTYDCKGFVTGKEWTRLPTFRVKGSKVWPFYDSFAPSSLVETQTMVKKRVELIDWSEPSTGNEAADAYLRRNDELGLRTLERDEGIEDRLDYTRVPGPKQGFLQMRRARLGAD